MGVVGVWRHFWAQRSRARLWLAAVCVVAALVAVAVIYVPGAWLEQVGAAIQAASAYLVSFGGRSWLFAAVGVLVVCALLLVVLPRRRPTAYWVRRPSGLSEVAVYLDLENQLSNTELRPFMRLLRKRLGGRRADLYYFADASRQAAGKMYQEVWRFGFRPVDVPHKHLGVQTVKNIVDVELSLFAYERALLGPRHQDIILIAADQDYLPLIYRLSALGHHVAVWGRTVPESYKSLQAYLDIEVFEFGAFLAQVGPAAGPAASPAPATAPANATKQQPAARRRRQRHGQPTNAVAAVDTIGTTAAPGTLLGAMQVTRELAQRIAGRNIPAERRIADFNAQLGALAPAFLKPIGYEGNSRSICWIECLCALGVLTEPAQHDAPGAGAADAAVAARALEAFLRDVTRAALALAEQVPNTIIRFVDLSKAMSQLDTSSLPVESAPLLALVSLPHRHHIAHTRYFCLCARELSMLRFDEVIKGTSLRVTLPTTAESPAPDATPGTDEPDDREHGATPYGEA